MSSTEKLYTPSSERASPSRRQQIMDMSKPMLAEWLAERNIAAYRADQIFKWLYQQQIDGFEEMTNISKEIRALLADHFSIDRLAEKHTQSAADGTIKYLFELADGLCIESVLIDEQDHLTLCISTQVGCAQGCRFCMTARRGFARNLSPSEISGQIRDIQNKLGNGPRLSNIVLMGMGEPLANYANVLTALDIITDGDCGMKFSTRRVTLSTVGIVPRLTDLGRASNINLAVSLNATDNETRDWLMPINRKYPIESLLTACAAYPLSKRRKITFEYILIKDINDSEADARRLIRLLKPIRAKINLIPFNEYPQCDLKRPDNAAIERFRQLLHDHHYTVMTRFSKGEEISAACGQLAGDIRKYSQ